MHNDIAAQIHETSLALLADPGIGVEHETIRDLLLKSGARDGRAAGVVRLSAQMVDEYVTLAPETVVLTDRQGHETYLGARGEPTFWSCPGLYLWREGQHRPFTTADMADMARLLDQLGHVDVIFGMSLDDVPPTVRDVVGVQIMAKNSRKHVRVLCFTPAGAETIVEMRQVVGDYPWLSVGFTAHGPLRWTNLALEIFQRTAGHGIPTTINGEPTAGVSGPVTLAGCAAVGNAEILAGIVINQLLEPGRPCIYNLGLAHIFDMKTAIAVTGAPENHLLADISALMGRFYNLPSASWVSTEAMCPDSQAALEKMLGFQTHVTSGVSAIWGMGQLESEMTISPAQAVIDNEIVGLVKRYQRGVEVSHESLALEATREVGIAGSFLDHMHTLKNFRSELYEPQILWRQPREAWEAEGCKRLDERAEEVAKELIQREPVEVISEDQSKALDAIVARFQRTATS